jgi:predicted transcriptional regulator
MQASMSKKVPTSIRLDDDLRKAAIKLAKKKDRSLSNLVSALLREACRKEGLL